MAAKKHTYTATLPDGRQVTRTTGRTYTHVVAVLFPGEDTWRDYGWAGSPTLAERARAQALNGRYARPGTQAQAVPVDAGSVRAA